LTLKSFLAQFLGRALGAAAALTLLAPDIVAAAESAVILMYHRFGEDRYPTTNIKLEQFEAHLAELKSGPYTVLPVSEITRRMQNGASFPERTVGITIDDGYLSIYREALPRLKAAGLPFTVFVSTDAIDRGLSSHMNWHQIRELKASGGEIGAHSASHFHMVTANDARIAAELDNSGKRYTEELGGVPRLFAYPYGEAGLREKKFVLGGGYSAAFGQHSGVFNPTSDPGYIPRFALNEQFGSIERFRLVVNALPIPTDDMTPVDANITGNNPPLLGFTVKGDLGSLKRLGCFSSSEGKLQVEILGNARVEIRLSQPMPEGRSRINCTMSDSSGRWRWLGRQYYVRPK